MPLIADLHVHSRYAQAVSPRMSLTELLRQAEIKGVDLIGTGDFTHPLHFQAIENELEPAEPGLLKMRHSQSRVRFLLSTEVSSIFYVRERQEKRVHTVILAPHLESVRTINRELSRWGHLEEDGRPTFRRHVKDLIRFLRQVHPDILAIPAHAWTPWYSLFGSQFGFNSIEECFEEETPFIQAIETGLDCDPAMVRRMPALDNVACVSFSDAHSPEKIGREATLFETPLDYAAIVHAIRTRDPRQLAGTLETDSRYGKYFWDGHRKCRVRLSPPETRRRKYLCPVCSNKVTVGVAHRLETLSGRPEGFQGSVPVFRTLLPLEELIAHSQGREVSAKSVDVEYERLIQTLGPELKILLDVPENELRLAAHPLTAEAILAIREKNFSVSPGYDGIWGKPEIISDERRLAFNRPQMEMF